jgi:hypothetical protein
MADFAEITRSYLATWNETDATRRAKLVSEVFAPDATYIDPMAEATGHDAVNGLVEAVQQQFTGLVFSAGGPVDGHHGIARFTWHLGPAGAAEPLVIGFDVISVDAAGRITSVLGFLDKVPQA